MFTLADKYRGRYTDSIPNAQAYYASYSGYEVHYPLSMHNILEHLTQPSYKPTLKPTPFSTFTPFITHIFYTSISSPPCCQLDGVIFVDSIWEVVTFVIQVCLAG